MIEFQSLHRCFGDFVALDSISCTIPAGATVGLIGPNGAGKTTAMRILTTLLAPTSGDVLVNGVSVHANPQEATQRIGFMPDEFGKYEAMSAAEYLDFYARCHYIPEHQRPVLVSEMLDLVDLAHKRDDAVMGLSRGMMQRLSLARSLLHNPDVLVLDEPASGLDPRARIDLRGLLHELHRQGKTILISSHILSDLADICTHLMILERGQLVAFDTLDNLMHRAHQQRIIVKVLHDSPFIETIAQQQGFTCQPHPEHPHCYVLLGNHDEHAHAQLLHALIDAGVSVYDFSREAHSLEHAFLQATSGTL
jgi:ABC-2 type transport system ATP-binding protein